MLIKDLSYCEVVEENVVGGSGTFASKFASVTSIVNQEFNVDIDVNADKDINADLDSDVDITGNFASLTGDATAIGEDTFAEVDFSVIATDGLSEVAVTAIAGVG
ncbi:MAG: hypothetical protein AAFO04_05640 [Cyanobacteria bacterium J06592_8]